MRFTPRGQRPLDLERYRRLREEHPGAALSAPLPPSGPPPSHLAQLFQQLATRTVAEAMAAHLDQHHARRPNCRRRRTPDDLTR